MKLNKKDIRRNFRDACFKRDKYKCVTCNKQSSPIKAIEELDAHHIINRNCLPGKGYCLENGISLCKDKCHLKAEEFHRTGIPLPGFSIEELFALINSSIKKAEESSNNL